MNNLKYWIMLVFASLFWAGNYILGKAVVTQMTPYQLTFFRWLFSSILLVVIAQLAEKPNWRRVVKSWPILLFLGLNGLVGYNLALYTALKYTTPISASLVSALNPALMVAVSAVVLKESLSDFQKLGIVSSLTGVLVILTQGNVARLVALDFNRGDLLMLVAISVWTVYSIVGKRLKEIRPITASAAAAVLSTLVLAPGMALQGLPVSLTSSGVLSVIYIIFFPSVGALMFWNLAVRQIGAATAGVTLNLIPVFTTLLSLFLGQSITLTQILGGLLVFSGVLMTSGLLERQRMKSLHKGGETL